MKILLKTYIRLTLVLLFISNSAFSQKTLFSLDAEADYKTGIELIEKQKFSGAQQHFDRIINLNKNSKSATITNSHYYSAICALELFHKDGDQKLINFINEYPKNENAEDAKFALANFYYRKKKYNNAIDWYKQINLYSIKSAKQTVEYYFKYGYSHFKLNEFNNAAKLFYEIRDIDGEYGELAKYYYSHIQYQNRNYETALIGFTDLKNSKKFSKIIPYYIIQIYYLQGRYEKTTEAGIALLDTVTSSKDNEICKLIGDSYYKNKQYKKAEVYLEKWQNSTPNLSSKDVYQLGYTYYLNNSYEKAIEKFEKILNKEDTITQYAYYYLGQSYLKFDRKKHARSAFEVASKLNFDLQLAEDAHYNTVKLLYETNTGIYSDALKASKEYLDKYPTSTKKDEVRKYMYIALLTTKNYKGAIEVIDAIKNKDDKTLEVYQKINYLRGVELFNNLDIKEAKEHFEVVTKYPYNRNLIALAMYWKAESSYKLKDYNGAVQEYENFIYTPWAVNLPVFNEAHYNIGYSYFMLKNYANSATWFRKYLAIDSPNKNDRLINDTYLRVADSYIAQRNFEEAIKYYDKAITTNNLDVDYAYYQKATANGLLNNYDKKISSLQSIIKLNTKSPYKDDATYEIAKTYLTKGNKDSALVYFNRLITNFEDSKLLSRALLGKGLIEYDLNNEHALKTFETVVDKYPATAQAKEALMGIKNIYIDKGQGSQYLAYIEKVPHQSITENTKDSILFKSAETTYFKQNFKLASSELEKYLAKYPNGFFILSAKFYKAECDNSFYKYDDAIKGYEFVVNEPFNSFTESSVAKLGKLYNQNNNTQKAIHNYLILEKIAEQKSNLIDARVNLMRVYYNTLQYNDAITYSQKLIDDKQIDNETRYAAYLIKGKSLMGIDNYNGALETLQKTFSLTKSIIGAEAKYYVAYIQYLQQDYKASEASVFTIANDMPAYDYWVAKSFILLADNYVKMGDNFQAEYTLKSIIENYDGAELRLIAQKKLNELKATETTLNEKDNKIVEEQIEINKDVNYDNLYGKEENK